MEFPDDRMSRAGDPPPLEEAIARAQSDSSEEVRLEVLRSYATGRVAVILDREWDGESLPDPEMRFLMVSDGPDTGQPMVAVFTDLGRARHFHDGLEDPAGFDHPIEVAGGWSLIGVPDGSGVFINPNQQPAFRIGPDAAARLREGVKEAMDRAMAGQGGEEEGR